MAPFRDYVLFFRVLSTTKKAMTVTAATATAR